MVVGGSIVNRMSLNQFNSSLCVSPLKRRIGWMIEHLGLKECDIHSNIELPIGWIIAPVVFLIGGIA